MKIVGLTGSIGMGKSTTADLFKQAGAAVFDADAHVHKFYAKGGEAVALIRAVYPDAITDGAVNRQVLGAHMKADPLALTVLESFIHPMVARARDRFINAAKVKGHKICVMDVPLLFETGGERYVDKIVVVTAPLSVQRERVLARPKMTKAFFEHILSRQMPDHEKRKQADFLIFTDKGIDDARKQVQKIMTILSDEL